MPAFSPGTEWVPLRRERVPSPLDRRGYGRASSGAEHAREEVQPWHVDDVAGRGDHSFVVRRRADAAAGYRGSTVRRSGAGWTDQALNLVTRVSDPSYASRSSDASTDLDVMDVMDDLDVAMDVATVRRMTDPGGVDRRDMQACLRLQEEGDTVAQGASYRPQVLSVRMTAVCATGGASGVVCCGRRCRLDGGGPASEQGEGVL